MSRTSPLGITLLGSILVAALGLACLLLPMGQGLVGGSYDLTVLAKRPVAPEGVTIVYMDLDSHARLQQELSQRWDRGLHARLIDRLKQLGARAVVFDVVFMATDSTPADAELVRAAREHGRVAVGALVTPEDHAGSVIGWKLTKPFPELEAVAAWGVVEVGVESGSVRQHYYRRDFDAPSLAWRAAELTDPDVRREPYRDRWMNYYGPPGLLRHFSYWEVLASNSVPAAAFSNQVVFVGARYEIGPTGGKVVDEFRTPYTGLTGRRAPGVEVLATAYLNIARDDALRRWPAWWESLLVAGVGALAAWGLMGCGPWRAAGTSALAVVAVAIVSVGITWTSGVWVPWLVIGVVQIPAALGWSLLASAGRRRIERPAPSPSLELSAMEERRVRRDLDRLRDASPRGGSASATPNAASLQDDTAATANEVKQIADHHLLRCIGKGAYGEVWLARSVIGTFHAIKLVHRDTFPDAAPYEREFNGLKKFTPISGTHPGFVHVLHVGRNEAGRFIYYVMEAADDEVSGQRIDPQTYSPRTLAKELLRRKRLPLEECLRLGADLADALHVLHSGQLIHRDIKPANIIFVNSAPKLADIGLVTEAADAGAVTYLGTKGYIPPEGPGTSAGDVYSLGKVLYEASVGLEVTHFPELPTAIAASSRDDPFFKLNQIVLKACETNPANRFASAAALRDALRELLKQLETPNHA